MSKTTSNADSNKFAEARIEAQNAAQWLARMARSYSERRRNDGEVQLLWDREMQRIVTPQVAPGVVLELSLPTLMLQFEEDGRPSPHAIDIDGKSSTEVEAWLLVELLHRGFDREVFSKKLPYIWGHQMSGDVAKYSPQELVRELQHLTQCFEEAAETLLQVKEALAIQYDGANGKSLPEILICWPDGFDIGFTIPAFATGARDGEVKVSFMLGEDKRSPPGYFVSKIGSGETCLVLPTSKVTADAMPQADVVKYITAKIKDVRRLASN